MTRSFIHDSDSRAIDGRVARLEIEISFHSNGPDDAGVSDLECIWDLERDCAVEFDSLPESEQRSINEAADALAYEQAHDIWLDKQITRADMYDPEDR